MPLIIQILAWLLILYILIGVGLGVWAAIASYWAYRHPSFERQNVELSGAWDRMHKKGMSHAHIACDVIVVSAYAWPKILRD